MNPITIQVLGELLVGAKLLHKFGRGMTFPIFNSKFGHHDDKKFDTPSALALNSSTFSPSSTRNS